MQAPSDQPAIDALMQRFFDAFDNREGVAADEAGLVELFTEKAVIARHVDGKCDLYSPREFAQPRIALLSSGELTHFHEWEESSTTKIVGDIATRASRYAKSGQLRRRDYRGRGTKFFQLAKILGAWRIVSLVWTDDTDSCTRDIDMTTDAETHS